MKPNSKSQADTHSTVELQKPIEPTSAQLEQNPMLATRAYLETFKIKKIC